MLTELVKITGIKTIKLLHTDFNNEDVLKPQIPGFILFFLRGSFLRRGFFSGSFFGSSLLSSLFRLAAVATCFREVLRLLIFQYQTNFIKVDGIISLDFD